MKAVKSLFLLLLVAAVALPSTADARQLRRLKERAKARAEQRAKEQVTDRADRAVDKAVDKAFAKAEEALTQSLSDMFTKSNTKYDPDTGILSREGREDVKLVDNADSPLSSDYLHYLNVTKTRIPALDGSSKDVYFAQDVYLHGGRELMDDGNEATLINLDDASYTQILHDNATFWTITLDEFTAMMDAQMAQVQQQMDDAETGMDDIDDEENPTKNVNMEFSVRTDKTGRSETMLGVPADQYVVVVETTIEATEEVEDDEEEEEVQRSGKFFSVFEIWTTDRLAGMHTMKEFGERTAKLMGGAFGQTQSGEIFGSDFPDSRFGASMERAGQEFQKIEGFAVSTTIYMVVAPEDAELDVDAVLKSKDEPLSFEALAASMSGDGDRLKGQVTVLTTTQFVSNASADAFDRSMVSVPSSYTETASPLAAMNNN